MKEYKISEWQLNMLDNALRLAYNSYYELDGLMTKEEVEDIVNYKPKSSYMKKVIYWSLIIVIVVILFLGLKSCCRASHYPLDVNITYVYENDTVEHSIKKHMVIDRNNFVKDIQVIFSAPAGYINKLILFAQTYNIPNMGYNHFDMELMNVPDRKFKVTNITWTKGDRYETNW